MISRALDPLSWSKQLKPSWWKSVKLTTLHTAGYVACRCLAMNIQVSSMPTTPEMHT